MAFAGLIDRYQSKIYNLSLRMTGVVEDAEDITQNVFLKVYSNLSSYNPEFRFFSWIYKTAVNESLNFISSRKSNKTLNPLDMFYEDSPEKKIIQNEKREQVRRIVLTLKPKYRTLIVLKYFEEMSYDEICLLTGISVKKVKSRLFEARNLLRKSLTAKI